MYPGVDSSLPTQTAQLARSHLMRATAMTPPNNICFYEVLEKTMKQFPSSPPTTGWVEYTAIYPSTRLFSVVEKRPVYKGTETILNENRPTKHEELSFLKDLCSKIKHWYKAQDQDFVTD